MSSLIQTNSIKNAIKGIGGSTTTPTPPTPSTLNTTSGESGYPGFATTTAWDFTTGYATQTFPTMTDRLGNLTPSFPLIYDNTYPSVNITPVAVGGTPFQITSLSANAFGVTATTNFPSSLVWINTAGTIANAGPLTNNLFYYPGGTASPPTDFAVSGTALPTNNHFFTALSFFVPQDYKVGTTMSILWNYEGNTSPLFPSSVQTYEFGLVRPSAVATFLGARQGFNVVPATPFAQPLPYNAEPYNQDTTTTYSGFVPGEEIYLGCYISYNGASFSGNMRLQSISYTAEYS